MGMVKLQKLLLMVVCLGFSGAAYAAGDVLASDVGMNEVAHESMVQAEMAKLQQERDAAFVKQLEAEMLIEEQRIAAIDAAAKAGTATSVAP